MSHTVGDDVDSFDDAFVRDVLARLGPGPAPPPLSMVMRRARRDVRRRRSVLALGGATAVVAATAGSVALLNRDGGGTSTITVTSPQGTSDEAAVTTTLPPTTAPTSSTDSPASATRRHTDDTWGFIVEIPATWGRSNAHPNAYIGDDGYLIVSAISAGQDLQALAQQEAAHALRPYGTAPTVTQTTVGGQRAAVIEPSADAPPNYGHLPAAVIVEMPEMRTVSGTVWQYLALHVDTGHLETVLATLTFD
ncbi:MAG TPA: hypothetical protein VF183_02235 [Acidimicrobiales bacterium]